MGRKSIQSYPSAQVRIYNERIRKLEKVYMTSEGISYAHSGKSNFYNMAQQWAYEEPNGKGKFFNMKVINGQTHIRLISKSDYDKMTTAEKAAFNRTVNAGLNAPTSTKTGIMNAQNKAVTTFMENHPEQFKAETPLKTIPKDASKEEIKRLKEENKLLKEENERLREENRAKASEMMDNLKNFFATNKDHFQYDKDTWALLSAHFDVNKWFGENYDKYGADRAANIFMRSWKYAQNEQWDKIPKGYRVSN